MIGCKTSYMQHGGKLLMLMGDYKQACGLGGKARWTPTYGFIRILLQSIKIHNFPDIPQGKYPSV